MSQTMTNGDSSSKLIDVSSAIIRPQPVALAPPSLHLHRLTIFQHVTSYPAVADGISTFKSNPYGAKSINLTQETYDKFVAPVVPYAARPYGFVAPYVAKADSLASDGLTKVDTRFPILKEDTQKIKGTLIDYAYFPFRVVGDGKNYVLDTYGQEYKKCGGDGYVSSGKALITTSMVVTSDTLAWLSSFLSAKKEEGKDFAAQKYDQGQTYAHRVSDYAGQKSGQAINYANEKSEMARNLAYQKGEEAKDAAKNAKETGEKKAKDMKSGK